ncbi:MAG: PQQ-dependent dehydrogenase, methanol/ethanol family [Paracraurococcus sp.]
MSHAAWSAALLCLGLAVIPAAAQQSAPAARLDDARLRNAAADPANWPTIGGTYDEQRYSPLDQINTDTIKDLKLAWYGDFDTSRGQEATPLVIDGVLYTSTAWSKVYAYDARTGQRLWVFDPEVPGAKGQDACCDVVNRGLAAFNGKIYVGALDGRLIAIDMKTGRQVWSTQTTDTNRPYTITGAPRIVKGKVLIGNGGAELGVRGYVGAYDAETGRQAWRFYFTPNPENKPDGAASDDILMRKAHESWGDGAWKQTGGGGTAWDAIVYDVEQNQVLVGTGNGSPWVFETRNGKGGNGDNLFLSSIVALDPDTGAYKWHYQETPGEEWDFTSVQPIILANMTIAGTPRKVLLHAPKNGFFYVIDRSNGRLLSAKNFTKVNWAAGIDIESGRPIEYPEARYSNHGREFMAQPAAFGSHNWHPMSFSPKTQLVYIPVQENPLGYKKDPNFVYRPQHGVWNMANGSTALTNTGPRNEPERIQLSQWNKGALVAWNPVTQSQAWRVQHPSMGAGGVLSTAGNLVFQGTPDGVFHAYRADNGLHLWQFEGHNGIIAGAMTYQVAGEQYVAVLAGFGGSNGLNVPYIDGAKAGQGRILVFKLNGTAALPPYKPEHRPPTIVPAATWTEAAVREGEAQYGNCVLCHGFSAISLGVVPDLRRSPVIADPQGFRAVVLGGILEPRGMPNMTGRMTEEQVEQVRAFVAARARQLAEDEAVRAKVTQ